jgi:hypothetical protein
MSESKPLPEPPLKQPETKPKKMVSRNVAIALGIICIILIAGLGGAMAYYVSTHSHTDSDYNSLSTQNTNLQNQLAGNITAYNNYVSDHSYTNEQYQNEVTAYQNEANQYKSYVNDHHHTDEDYANVNDIANLVDSTVWVNDQTISQPAGAYTVWTLSASYAGYVAVWVQSSTVSGTHIEVTYSAYGVSFDQTQVISAGDTAAFPILPCSDITVGVGNGNIIGGATETVTITYYY